MGRVGSHSLNLKRSSCGNSLNKFKNHLRKLPRNGLISSVMTMCSTSYVNFWDGTMLCLIYRCSSRMKRYASMMKFGNLSVRIWNGTFSSRVENKNPTTFRVSSPMEVHKSRDPPYVWTTYVTLDGVCIFGTREDYYPRNQGLFVWVHEDFVDDTSFFEYAKWNIIPQYMDDYRNLKTFRDCLQRQHRFQVTVWKTSSSSDDFFSPPPKPQRRRHVITID